MLGRIASYAGLGMAAGFVGTLAMTAAQSLEMAVTKRQTSNTPAKGVEKVLAVKPQTKRAETRLNWLTHIAYGTGWGAVRGVLGALRMDTRKTTAVHWAAVQLTEYVMLPSLKLAPPVTKWGAQPAVSDLGFHLVYAITTGFVFERLRDDAEFTSGRPVIQR